jgi:hypothetical protein
VRIVVPRASGGIRATSEGSFGKVLMTRGAPAATIAV